MQKYNIITTPNPILKETTNPVKEISDNVRAQISVMIEALRKEGGVGIAANQLGYENQIIAIEFDDPDKKNTIPLTVFVNPEIVEYSDEKDCLEEGCLSIPKIELETERSVQIKLKYTDEHGHNIKVAPKGLLARILQHEIDHLNGILFTERAKEKFFKDFPHLKDLKITFCGTGQFAAIILEGLIHLGLNLDVITEKSKPTGRSKEPIPTIVAETAKKFGKKYEEASSSDELISSVSETDLIICADFGKRLPQEFLKKAKIDAINIHGSILPRYRGPSPIQTAILNGEKTTGISIIRMVEEIDEGPILALSETEILPNDDYLILRDRLATIALKLLVKALPKIIDKSLGEFPQDKARATTTKKFTKTDGEIDWLRKTEVIEHQIRAFHPWPGSYTMIGGKRLIIHRAHIEKDKLALDDVQLEGKQAMPFNIFLRGWKGEKPDWFNKIYLPEK